MTVTCCARKDHSSDSAMTTCVSVSPGGTSSACQVFIALFPGFYARFTALSKKADLGQTRRWRPLRLAMAMITATVATGMTAVIMPEAASASIPGCLAGEIVGIAATADGNGYWLAGADGGVFSYGDAKFFGSIAPAAEQADRGHRDHRRRQRVLADRRRRRRLHLRRRGGAVEQPTAGHEAQRPRRRRGPALGTWSSPPGTAACSPSAAPPYHGSTGDGRLNKPVVGIVSTADGNGYWLIGADGGVFAFGDAAAPSSNPLPGMKLNAPVVGAARAGASGLELTAGDGGVFALGGAPYLGSMAGHSLAAACLGHRHEARQRRRLAHRPRCAASSPSATEGSTGTRSAHPALRLPLQAA